MSFLNSLSRFKEESATRLGLTVLSFDQQDILDTHLTQQWSAADHGKFWHTFEKVLMKLNLVSWLKTESKHCDDLTGLHQARSSKIEIKGLVISLARCFFVVYADIFEKLCRQAWFIWPDVADMTPVDSLSAFFQKQLSWVLLTWQFQFTIPIFEIKFWVILTSLRWSSCLKKRQHDSWIAEQTKR